MQISHYATADALAAGLIASWHGPAADPFRFDLAVVPTAGFQRWISQQLALADAGAGICAGVEFISPGALWTRVAGRDDPWRPDRLGWTIQKLVLAEDAPAELDVVRRHLAASREASTTCLRIATHFAGYASHLPQMLTRWADGDDVDSSGRPLTDHAWQPALWRLLVDELGISPLTHRQAVLDGLRAAPAAGVPDRIAVLAPPRLDPTTLAFYEALSTHHRLHLLALTPSPSRRPILVDGARRADLLRSNGHPLNQTLGTVADESAALLPPAAAMPPPPRPQNLLGWLATDLFADRPPTSRTLSADDRSVQLHFSHGPSRQVEVLREVLAELYRDDASLEPRHIAVLTPDVDSYGPLLDAAFAPQPGGVGHPAQQFRLRRADRTAAQANPLVTLLLTLLRLPDSRFEAATVLEFCAHEAVATRFGFSPDDRERLAELVKASGIRWGLSAAHRAEFGLPNLAHNTWQAGLQRMLLGVTLSEEHLVSAGTVLPMDDIDSSDVALVGALTELIGRLTRWTTTLATAATLSDWVQRCRDGLDSLTLLTAAQEWQRGELFAELARLSDAEAGSGVLVTRQAVINAVERAFTTSPARGAFGNGSTIVAGLDSLRSVPHRVVILLGWDAERYPHSRRRHGDDLLGDQAPVGTPSAALADRQALLDAVHAAGDKLIVICRGRSEATNQDVPPATPIAELIDALNLTAVTADGVPAGTAVSRQHPLQPFAPEHFAPDGDVRSVDPLAYAAARAWLAAREHPEPERDRYRLDVLPPIDLGNGVSLDELTDFFRHPARTLLKVRAGLSFGDEPDLESAIPIEPDGLARWQIGNRVLHRLQEGLDPDLVERAEWLRGQVPPFELGHQLMGGIVTDARRTLASTPPPGPAELHDLSLRVPVDGFGDVAVTGRVATRETTIWQVEFSALQPRQKITAWLRLLALAAGEPGAWSARAVGKGRQVHYQAPSPERARELLGRYLAIYAIGLRQPIPALPRLTAEWAGLRLSRLDPQDSRQKKSLRRCWDWESDSAWTKFFDYPDVLDLPVTMSLPGADSREGTLVGALASSIWMPALEAEVAP